MSKTISKKSSVKSSADKPPEKPLPGDNNFGIEPDIRSYTIEDADETEEVEEA